MVLGGSLFQSIGSWVLGLGSWVLGLGSWVLGLGSWVLGPGFWVLGPGSWVLGPGFWVLGLGSWVLGLGSWVLGPGSWVLGPGSWVLGPGFWVQVQGPTFRVWCTGSWILLSRETPPAPSLGTSLMSSRLLQPRTGSWIPRWISWERKWLPWILSGGSRNGFAPVVLWGFQEGFRSGPLLLQSSASFASNVDVTACVTGCV